MDPHKISSVNIGASVWPTTLVSCYKWCLGLKYLLINETIVCLQFLVLSKLHFILRIGRFTLIALTDDGNECKSTKWKRNQFSDFVPCLPVWAYRRKGKVRDTFSVLLSLLANYCIVESFLEGCRIEVCICTKKGEHLNFFFMLLYINQTL